MSVIRHPNTAGATLTQWRYTATGGETSLSGTDGFSTALSYTVGSEQVFINGVLLERGVDYAATTGTTITGLTALVANDIATVISPSSFNVANAIPKSTVTAKGDLIAASSSGTVTNLAVGADGTTLVANSASATGVAWTAGNPIPNPVLNSAMQVWQRGTSMAGSATAFAGDRWQAYRSVAGSTYSRQVTGDTTNLAFIQYCTRVQRDSGNTSVSGNYLIENFESTNSIPFAGKTVTLSFYARAGANYSPTSAAMEYNLATGTGTDQNLLTGFTGRANPILGNATLTTTWQRFTASAALSSSATQIAISFDATWVGTAGAADYFEITGVQLDIGSVALPFRTYAGTLQGELAACQRYYWRTTPGNTYGHYGLGMAGSTTAAYVELKLPITMRVIPTSIDVPSTITRLKLTNVAATNWTISAIGLTDSTQDNLALAVTASSMTANQALILGNNNDTAGFIGASAEL